MSSSDGIVAAASLPVQAAAGQVKPIVVLFPDCSAASEQIKGRHLAPARSPKNVYHTS